METKHTPGPWAKFGSVIRSLAGSDRKVADVRIIDAEGQANAKLIAAAPDLLEALEDLLSRCESLSVDGVGPQKVAARQAIAKARSA